MKPALYVLEGPDGVGKSTLALDLNDHLNNCGLSSKLLSFPGREIGTVGEHIYRLYHNPQSFGIHTISVTVEQLLCTAAHTDVIENRIIPAMSKGLNIVLDRYWWSTWVYATIRNLDSRVKKLLIELELEIWGSVKPTCVFLVHRDRPTESEHTPERWSNLVSLYDEIRSNQANQVKTIDVNNNRELKDTIQFVHDAVKI